MKLEGRLSFSPVVKIVTATVFAIGGLLLMYGSTYAAVGDVTDISLYDGNGNGKIDEVRVSISNPLATAWIKNGTPAFTAESDDGGAAITVISSSFYSSQVANPIVVSIALDENDSDLTVNTDVDAVAIVYTQDGGAGACTNCFTNGAVELAAIATGDSGAGDTEVDAAKPVVVSSTFKDASLSDAKLDQITTVFSEPISAVADGSADWAISSAANFAGLSEGTVECNSGGAGATECDYNFTTTTKKTEVGDLTLTYTAGTSVTDGVNTANTIALSSASSPAFTDGAGPQLVSASTIDNNSDGTADYIRVVYSESMLDSSIAAGDFIAGIAATEAANLTESFASGTPSSGNYTDTANDSTVYIGIASSGETITAKDTDLAFVIEQTGSVTEYNAAGNTLASFADEVPTDGMAPQIKTAAYQDADADGKIDTFSLDFTETLGAASTLAHENLVLTVGDFTSAAFGTAAVDLVGAVATIDITLGTEASVVDTYESSGSIALTTQDGGTITFSLTDGTNENTTPKAETQVTFLDEAKPVISSTTPTDAGSAYVSRTNSVSWTFSEPMATAGGWVHASEFTSTPNPGGWGTAAWSSGNTVVTASHAIFGCATSYSIVTDDTQIAATNGESGYTALNDAATAPIGTALTFTSLACSGTSGTSTTETTYDLTIDTPVAGEELSGGEYYEIEWSSSPEGQYFVDLYYLNSEGQYTAIATAEPNIGSYSWLVPEVNLSATDIYIIWNDLADELDSAFSDDFSIVTTDTAEDTSDDSSSDEASDAVGTGEYGINPFTGETEEIDLVETGDYFKSTESSTVYYLDADGTRRPFMNGQSFFTWADSWDDVMVVSGATLTEYSVGTPMLPQEGVTMVKIQSDAKTYVIEGENTLRWVTSEQVASDLYGSEWNAYIIDIEPTFFSKFMMGDDLESASDYDGLSGKTAKSRIDLSV